MKRKSKKSLNIKPVALLAVAAVLLIGSTVGSTQAALTYYSDNYSAQVTVSNIDIALLENGTETTGTLLQSIDQESFKVGQVYDEELSVKNTGAIDTYVRVILTKSWQDANGVKNTSLSPELIELVTVNGNGWVEDTAAATDERTVLYYTNPLKKGETSPICTDTIGIDSAVTSKVNETRTTDANGTTITYTYAYNGYTFNVEAEVDAVQTHNAEAAIKSAWGVTVKETIAADGSRSIALLNQ